MRRKSLSLSFAMPIKNEPEKKLETGDREPSFQLLAPAKQDK